jgi:hypothetical protein
VTSNEFYLRFIKGYIAQEKGIKVNWAKAIASTTRYKLKRKEIATWKLAHGSTFKNHNGSGMEDLAFLGDDNVIISRSKDSKRRACAFKDCC